MDEDMNGSAVALGITDGYNARQPPDKYRLLARNCSKFISPRAYKQNDVITALNGTTIEIIHTDAEGRMVLADTLTLAARERPDVMIDFATLTGSMHTALGSRYSGIFSNRDDLVQKALAAGKSSGERIWAFPSDADYDSELESKIADTKQCTLGGGSRSHSCCAVSESVRRQVTLAAYGCLREQQQRWVGYRRQRYYRLRGGVGS